MNLKTSMIFTLFFLLTICVIGFLSLPILIFAVGPKGLIPPATAYLVFVLTFPVTLVLSLFLANKVNPKFIFLGFINALPIIGILFYLFNPFEIMQTKKEIRSNNIKKINEAPRDFVCEDGSFISIGNSAVHYYDSKFIYDLGNHSFLNIGSVTKGKSNLRDFAVFVDGERVKKAVATCKNKEDKTLLQVYPPQQEDLRK